MNRENDDIVIGVDRSRKHALMQCGAEYYKTKRYQEALDIFEEVILIDSNEAIAYVGKGDCLRQLGHHGRACHTYEQALAIEPNNISALVGSSYALVELGENYRASLAYQEALRLDPKNASAYNVAGQILCSQSMIEEALQAFEEAIRLATADNNLAGFYNNKGIALREVKRYQEALEAFIQVLVLKPGNGKYLDHILLIPRYERFKKANHYCDQADVLSSQHRYEEALRLFDTALQIDSDHIRACIGRGYALLFCLFYEEALLTFDTHLQIYSRRIQALLGKGIAQYALRSFEEALKTFEQAILLDNQLTHAYVAKGHAYVALNLPMDALKCYGEAIDLGTVDISCYINVGKILLELYGYEEVIRIYEKAFQLIPGLRSTYPERKNTLFRSSWYGQYLTASRELVRQECANIAIYLSMEETLTALGFQYEAAEAFEKALMLGLTKDSGDVGQIRSLINHPQTERRPAQIQFELLQRYITYGLPRPQRRNAIERISGLYPELFEINNVLTDIFQRNVQTLNSLLLSIPVEERAEALTRIAGNDDIHIAQLLIYLAPFSILGLAALAHQVTLRWAITPRNDDLVIRFYHVLESYSVPYEDADWLFAQELMLEGLYIQVKSVLVDLVKQHPTPNRLWLLATAMWHRNDPLREQIEVLHQFIASSVSSDTRCGEAWKRIGELSLEMNEGVAAITAFQEASRYIDSIPQLEFYRSGNWEALPSLHTHPDFAFPVIVVVDLECDYQPNAADGSRVFEIAAVRVKGHTELDKCNLVIRRDFSSKVSHRQSEAIEAEQARDLLQEFIGSSIVVGHNLQGFDVKHLRGMKIEIDDDLIIDTLSFARLLYPDSVYHHLALLCEKFNIQPPGEWHTALADARACADLLNALGDELVRRGGLLLAGFRVYVPRGSAFDRAVLQPRGITAVSQLYLDPSPTMPHILVPAQQESASPCILAALEQHIDALVERYDLSGAYVQHLPVDQRVIVVVNSRTRLERMLAQLQDTLNLFVLPDPRTLLCPLLLRNAIKQAQNWQMKLTLFCLYQGSHNHDVRTLYPLRLPAEDPFLDELQQLLLASCCASDWQHFDSCPGMLDAKAAAENHRLVFATHESFLHQQCQPEADVIIVDDADKLQMHFADYLAERLTSEQVRAWSSEVFHLIDAQIARFVKERMSDPGLYERVPMQSIVSYLTLPQGEDNNSLLSILQSIEPIGAAIAATLEKLCHQASQETTTPKEIHAYWLELRTAREPENEAWNIEQWCFCGLDLDLQQAFQQFFWDPYGQHLICGTAIRLGALHTTFLTRFFGLHENLALLVDPHPASQVLIPSSEDLRPYSYLGRRPWTRSVGNLLYHISASSKRSLMVTIQTPSIANALAQAFKEQQHETHRQVLSRQLGWTTTKIADRLADETRSTIAFIPPRLRETALDIPVDVEATGPLRFLNQRDPLVAAHLQLYAKLYPNENPFSSYLLPQALLELKTRISSSAKLHIILDSGLRSKVYHDEVCSLFQQDTLLDNVPLGITGRRQDGSILFQQDALLDNFPGISGDEQVVPDVFSIVLDAALERWGMSARTSIEDETLHLALKTYWGTDSFREAPLNQKEIVRAVLDGSDQLVIAATGGGKSLCFQLPAIFKAQEIVPKVTLVVNPLIALMQDQVEALKEKGVFSAIAWNSTLKPAERKNYLEGIKRGWYSIIYIAPEQIHYASLRKALALREIGFIAIDEAHCVSQWGHDFRTAYIALKTWIERQLCEGQKRTFPIIALTATARKGYTDSATGTREQGTVQEIIENLGLQTMGDDVKVTSLKRPELEYCVERITLPCHYCQFHFAIGVESVKCPSCGRWCRVEEEQIEQAKVERLIVMLAGRDGQGLRQKWDRPYGKRQRGLIYCAYTKTTKTIIDILRAQPQLAGLNVQAYHGKMSDDVKEWVYNSFIRDDEEGIDIVVATNAFGMGIDIRRLGFVIHFDIPGTLEAYIQEAGRAGRDPVFKEGEERAKCILLYHEHDLEKQRGLNKMNSIGDQEVTDVYEALRKFRSRGEQEIFVTTSEIKSLTGIGESKSQSILYYLERHTRVNGTPLLERGENARTDWLLSFEHGYEERIDFPAVRDLSRQLIDVFRSTEAFRLQEREIRMIDGDDMADYLGWETEVLVDEVNNLVNRHILVHVNHLLIQWLKSKDEACQLITQLERDVSNLVCAMLDQPTFRNGKDISVDLERLHDEEKLSTESLPAFTRFLDALSKNSAAPLRLFEYFERELSGNTK